MKVRNGLLALIFAAVAAGCGGSSSGGEASRSSDGDAVSAEATSAEGTSTGASDSGVSNFEADSEGPCGLLSVSEVQDLTGLTVGDVLGNSGAGGFGNCVWTFEEVVEDGVFAGEHPELLVATFESSEFYDQSIEGYPDSIVEEVGDGGYSRAPGEVIFLSGGNSAQVGLMLLFDSDHPDDASAIALEISKALVGRI